MFLQSASERSADGLQDAALTRPSCVCGRSVSTGSSRSCAWRGPGRGGRRPGILRSGQVSHTERAQWSSSTNTLRRNTRCWLLVREKAHASIRPSPAAMRRMAGYNAFACICERLCQPCLSVSEISHNTLDRFERNVQKLITGYTAATD